MFTQTDIAPPWPGGSSNLDETWWGTPPDDALHGPSALFDAERLSIDTWDGSAPFDPVDLLQGATM